jgi:superfamily II DNA or RNA helicase
MITLRPHQVEMIEEIYKFLRKGLKRLLVYGAMRMGKSYVFCYIAKKATEKGSKVLITTDRKVLFEQTNRSLVDFDLHPFYITSGIKNPPKNGEQVFITTCVALQNRLKKDNWRSALNDIDIVIIDEPHRQSFNYIFTDPLFSNSLILGFTGSPIRFGSQVQLGDQYQQIVLGPNTKQLEKLGYSVPLRVFDHPAPDMSGISKDANGEFNNYETFKRFDSPILYSGVVENWQKICPGECTIVYCVNIAHAVKTTEAFQDAGVDARFITSKPENPKEPTINRPADLTKYRIKKEAFEAYESAVKKWGGKIEDWKAGKFPVLINVDMFTFGFDHPPMKCVVLNRATNSTALFLQMGLRGATPMKGKEESFLLDFGGNVDRLSDGIYNKEFEWSLFHTKRENGGGIPASKECKRCGALVLASAKICEWCGYEFPKTKKEEFIELIEKKYSDKNAREIDASKMTIDELEEYTSQKGYKKAWLWRQIYFAHGEDALKAYAKKNGYHWSWAKRIIDRYEK